MRVADVVLSSGRPDQTVVLTGGIRTPCDALVGPVAVEALRTLHLDLVFLGVHGMDERRASPRPNLMESETDRALVEAGRQLVVVADHSKWGVVGPGHDRPVVRRRRPHHGRGASAERPRGARLPGRRTRHRADAGRPSPGSGEHATHGGPPRGRARAGALRRRRRPRAVAGRHAAARAARRRAPAAARPALDEWVSIAAHRMGRTFLPPADDCPLCPSRPGYPTEIPSDDYDVVVFENRFPSFVGPRPARSWPTGRSSTTPPGAAARSSASPPTTRARSPASTVDRARPSSRRGPTARRRCRATPGVEQVFVFENRGEAIGVTLRHPHGQIYAYPFVTPRTRAQLDSGAATARAPAATSTTTSSPPSSPTAGVVRDGVRALGRVRAVRRALAGRGAPLPAPRRAGPRRARRTPSATTSRTSTSTCCAAATHFFGIPLPYIAAWHQAPVRSSATPARCTSSCSPCSAAPTSSSSSRAPSRRWARS